MEPYVRPSSAIPDPARIAQYWWDRNAEDYLREHPALGEIRFQWSPEGYTEEDLRLLPDRPGRILEIGAGAAQCSRWLAAHGHSPVASDVSAGMLKAAAVLNERTGVHVPLVQADVTALPFAESSFDTVFTSFGALSFLPDLTAAFAEIFRVLRPGGSWIYSVTHPFSWVFPDSPFAADLTVIRPYGTAEAYVEEADGQAVYAEFPHTVADHMNGLVGVGFLIEGVLEPGWKAGTDETWGAWGPDRGAMLPGTLIVSARRPANLARHRPQPKAGRTGRPRTPSAQ